MHYPTKKLDHLVFVDVNPVLELVSHLIGVSFIDKHMLDEIFKPNLPADAQRKLRDYGRFSRDILDSSFPFSSPFTADVFLDLLEHLSVVARIVKAGQTTTSSRVLYLMHLNTSSETRNRTVPIHGV